MSGYLEQAENTYRRLRTKVDCLCLGLNKPDGNPLDHVYLHPLTAGHHTMMERGFTDKGEASVTMACLDFFLLCAEDENGRRVFNKEERQQLPYRIPGTRTKKLVPKILKAMRNDHDEFIEEEKQNFDEADSSVSALR